VTLLRTQQENPMSTDNSMECGFGRLFEHVDKLAESGQLRRLSAAFARFIVGLDVEAGPAPQQNAALALACVLLSELEGRGHSCLVLDDLARDPCLLMGWTEPEWSALADAAGALPAASAGWQALLAQSSSVWQVGAPDCQQPLVHDGGRLYLRRYGRHEMHVAQAMAALLDALPAKAMLILLGDKDQLASVEAGAVLGDLCHDAQAGGYCSSTLAYVQAASGQTIAAAFHGDGGALAQQTVMLRQSRRFSGPIGKLALAVNAGLAADVLDCLRGGAAAGADGQVAWIEPAQPSALLQLAWSGRPGAGGGYRDYLALVKAGPGAQDHPAWVREVLLVFQSFRILCAVRDGEWGVAGINLAIEQRLEQEGMLARRAWYVGRPVMVTRNDYDAKVFNGDIGLTLRDPSRAASLRVYFLEGDVVRSVLATRLRHVETAFAMTVHKSQGSEFLHTVLVLPKDGAGMLARELIYTGITRARKFFTLVSPTQTVLLDALGRRTRRASGLRSLLM
jgi:ATP-dependent exoDNAse (exonuclease V) alpha subunit